MYVPITRRKLLSCTWLTAREVATHLGMNLQTVLRWLREGKIKAYKPGGRDWRVCLTELDEFVRAKSNQ